MTRCWNENSYKRSMGRTPKLNGREAGLLRGIGFGIGVTGEDLMERMQMSAEDLCDVLNTLLDIGYVETASMKERVTVEELGKENFEINPSYASDLKQALRR